jgi:ankyrin repeat domain-containing protein 50
LLRQVCADDVAVPAAVQELYTKYNQTGHQPSTRDVESALLSVIDLGKDIYIILDALDEVPENTGISKRVEVLKLIEKFVALKRPNLHILVTSRDESDIRSRLGPLSNGGIPIQGSTVDEDIRRYVRSCLMEDDRLRGLEPRLKDMIETTLGEKAKGM